MRRVSLSKLIHIFTSIVYLFTFLGPSIALASQTTTVEEETKVLRLRRAADYKRFDLTVTRNERRGGVDVYLQEHGQEHQPFSGFISEARPLHKQGYVDLMDGDQRIGFTATIPSFGTLQCDWQGNLKLIGTPTNNVALTISTKGSLSLSDFTFKNLVSHAKDVTLEEGITLLEDSLFDTKKVLVRQKLLKNSAHMCFNANATLEVQYKFINTGEIKGLKNLKFLLNDFENPGTTACDGALEAEITNLVNQGFILGEKRTSLTIGGSLCNREGQIGTYEVKDPQTHKVTVHGEKTSLDLNFADPSAVLHLGGVRGKEVLLRDLSGAAAFRLKNGIVSGTEEVSLIGKSPTLANVSFITERLLLDAQTFSLGDQGRVERTLVMRAKNQNFTLTSPYRTNGTLEFWQRDLEDEDAVKAAMLARFGHERGVAPAPTMTINLQATIQAAQGLEFFTPFAKIRLGLAPAVATPEFFLTNDNGKQEEGEAVHSGDLTAYATIFDLEKGLLVGKGAFIHAPGGILTGRLVKDLRAEMLSEKLYQRNKSSLFFEAGAVHFKGPLQHSAELVAESLVLDSPKDHLFLTGEARVQNCELRGGGNLDLKRKIFNCRTQIWTTHGVFLMSFVASDPAQLRVFKNLCGQGKITNEISTLHAHKVEPSIHYTPLELLLNQQKDLKGAYNPSLKGTLWDAMNRFTFDEKKDGVCDLVAKVNFSKLYRFAGIFHCNAINKYATQTKVKVSPQTGFGTNTFMAAENGVMTKLQGHVSAPALVIANGAAGTSITGSLEKKVLRSGMKDLTPETIDLRITYMNDNLKALMARKPETEVYVKLRKKWFYDAGHDRKFYGNVKPYVRVANPRGNGFHDIKDQKQVLYSVSYEMMVKAVQDEAMDVLKRGNIYDNRPLDEAQILELHQNFVEYLEETGGPNAQGKQGPLTLATMTGNGSRPEPQKPMIFYKSAINAEGLEELMPVVFIPPPMHHDGGIQTKLLLTIPAGMSLVDWIEEAKRNPLARKALETLSEVAPGMFSGINQAAIEYNDKALKIAKGKAPAGEVALRTFDAPGNGDLYLSGRINVKQFFAIATGDIKSNADITCEDALLMSLLHDVHIRSDVTRVGNSQNFYDTILSQARIRAKNMIQIFAGQNVVFQAADTISELGTEIIALAKILDVPAHLVSQRIQALTGKYEGTETYINVHAKTSTHTSTKGNITQQAGDTIDHHGTSFKALLLDFQANGDINSHDVHHQNSHSWEGEKGSKKRSEQRHTSYSDGCSYEATAGPAKFLSKQGDGKFKATKFKGGHGAIIRAPNGSVQFLLGRNTLDISSYSNSDGMMWKIMDTETESHVTFTAPKSDGPVKVYAKKTLHQSIKGKESAFLSNLEVEEGSFVNQVIAELYENHSKNVEGPGMALAIIVAVVVACCTGGAGLAGALSAGLTSAGVSSGMVGALAIGFTAAINTGITNHLLDTMAAGGDLFESSKKAHSGERLKEAGIAGLKAALAPGSGFGDTSQMNYAEKFATSLAQNATSKTVDAGVDSIVNGRDFQEAFFEGLKTALVNTALDSVTDAAVGSAPKKGIPKEVPAGAVVGQITAKMVRNYASNSILGDTSKDALVKAVAQGAAELAYHGTKGAVEHLNKSADKGKGEATATAAPQQKRDLSDVVDSLHKIVDSIEKDEAGSAAAAAPSSRPVNLENSFLHKALPALSKSINYVVNKIGDSLDNLSREVSDSLEAIKKDLRKAAIRNYKELREYGHSVKEAWNDILELTGKNFQNQAARLLQNQPSVRPVVLPLVAAAALAPEVVAVVTGLGTFITGLVVQDYIEKSILHPGSTRGHQEGFDAHAAGPSVETFPAHTPEPFQEGFAAHPDDFSATRGGFEADPRASAPKVFSTPQLDREDQPSIFMNEDAAGPSSLSGPKTTPSGRRGLPGVASHDGALPKEAKRSNWIRGSEGNAAKVPAEIADKLAGREFRNFDHFREEFWLEVSKNPKLSGEFNKNNRKLMSQGNAPFVHKSQRVGGRKRFELDHMQELQHGGNVYDMNNIIIRSPLNHIKGKK